MNEKKAPQKKDAPRVSLEVYLIASGKRQDQTAGFRTWATACRLKPRTMLEWAEKWDEFMNRPTY